MQLMETTSIDLYKKSVQSKRVPLSVGDSLFLWMNPIACILAIPMYIFYKFGFSINMAIILLWSVGIYNVYTNIRDTKFKFLANNASLLTKEEVILQLQQKLGWRLENQSRQYFRFHEPMTWKKWSTYITIVWNEEGYFVNCLDSWFRTVTLFSNPWEQVEDIIADLAYMSYRAKTRRLTQNNDVGTIKA